MKYSFIIITSIFILACTNVKTERENSLIAYNYDKSIKLTELELQNWLNDDEKKKLLDHKTQIESYFLQETLFNMKSKLDDEMIKKLDFLNNYTKNRMAIPILKKKIQQQVDLDQKLYDDLYTSYKLGNDTITKKVRLYQIFKRYPLNASSIEKEKINDAMKEIRNQINNLDDFKKFAEKESNAQSRFKKGLIGNVKNGLFPEKLDSIVMKMTKGELSEIIKGEQGELLFYCDDVIIPKKYSDEELQEMAFKRIHNYQKKQNWENYQQDKISALNIAYNFVNLDKDKNDIIASSLLGNINNQKLKWILGWKSKPLSSFNKERLKSTIESFFLNQYLFNQLDANELTELNSQFESTSKQTIISNVLNLLADKRKKAPSEIELKDYYELNKHLLKIRKSYNFSILGLPTNDENKIEFYEKLEKIYNEISQNIIDFDSAIHKYSRVKEKFRNNKSGSLNSAQISDRFGFNFTRQLMKMKIGEMSDLLESEDGLLCIIRLDKIEEPRILTYSESKEKVIKKLNAKIIMDLKEIIINELIENQNITIL